MTDAFSQFEDYKEDPYAQFKDAKEDDPYAQFADAPTEAPSLLASGAQGLVSGAGGIARSGLMLAGGLASLVHQEAGDDIFRAADKVGELANEAVLSKEEQAQQGFGGKVAQALGGVAPAIAAGVVNPALGMMAMTAPAMSNTGADLIKEGAPLGEAIGAGGVATAGAALSAAIPLLGKSIPKAAGIQAVVNPVIGAAQDKAISSILTDPNLKNNYRWDDAEARAIDAFVGAATGAGFKYGQQRQAKRMGNEINEALFGTQQVTDEVRQQRIGDFLHKMQLVTDQELGIVKPKYNLGDQSPDVAFENLLKGKGRYVDGLDIMVQDVNNTFTDEGQRAVATRLLDRSHALGLDNMMLESVPDLDAGGRYVADQDLVKIKESKKNKAKTMLHEGGHAVLFAAGELYLQNKTTRANLKPEQQQVWDRMHALNQVYEWATRVRSGQLKMKTEDFLKVVDETSRGLEPSIEIPYEQQEAVKQRQREGRPPVEDVPQEMMDEFARREQQGIENIDYGPPPMDEEAAMDAATAPRKIDLPELSPEKKQWALKHYGFRDLHEFMSEVLSSKDLQGWLRSIPVTPNQVMQFGLKRQGKFMNMWDVVKRTITRVLGGETRGTMFDIAMDHVMFNIESTTAKDRILNPSKYSNELRKGIGEVNRFLREREAAGKTEEKKAAEKATHEDTAVRETMYKIANIREAVSDDPILGLKEFILRAREIAPGPEWSEFIQKNGKDLFNSKAALADYKGRLTSQMPEAEKKWVLDAQSVNDFAKDLFGTAIGEGRALRPLSVLEDVSSNMWNYIWGTSAKNLLQYEHGKGGKVLKYFNDQADRYTSLKEQLYSRAMNNFKEFYSLPRKEAMRVMEMIIRTDTRKNRQKLKEQGRQWLNEEELKVEKMNSKQIEAYKNMTKALDDMYDLLDIVRVRRGEDKMERIPLFMPHVWNGAFKTKLKAAKYVRDEKGEWHFQNERVVRVDAANNIHFGPVARMLKEFKEPKEIPGKDADEKIVFSLDKDTRTEKPYYVTKLNDPQSSMLGTLNEHLEAYQNSLQLSPETMKILERIEANATIGVNRHMMERSNVHGWMGQEGFSKWNYGKNTDILELWQRYARAVTDHYGNTAFHEEILSPLLDTQDPSGSGKTRLGNMFERTPNLNKHLREFEKNFSGENPNKLGMVDSFFEKSFAKLGLNPHAVRLGVRELRSLMAWSKLTFSPSFHLANSIQSINTGMILHMIDAERVAQGGKTLNISKAMKDGLLNYYKPSQDAKDALEYAKHTHVLDAQLAHELSSVHVEQTNYRKFGAGTQNAKNLFDLVQRVERMGRTKSYLMAYEYFKQVHGEGRVAQEAAVKAMKLAMVDYDRTSRPLMFQNTGVVGESFSPFAVFRNNYMGIALEMGKIIARNPGKARSYAPALVWVAQSLALAGAAGLPLAAEWEVISRLWNNIFPEEWGIPTFSEAVMSLTEGAPKQVQDGALFGVLDGVTGARIGGSMAATSFTDAASAPLPEFAAALGSFLTQSTIGSDPEAKYKATRALTPSSMWNMSQGMREKMGFGVPGIGDNAYNTNSEVGLKGQSLAGWQTKEPADFIYNLLGMQSTREAREKLVLSMDARDQQANIKRYKNIINQLAEHAIKVKPVADREALVQKALELNPDKTIDDINREISEEVRNRNISQKYKIGSQYTVESIKRLKKYEERMGN